jgi:hypothetical protein
LDSEASPRREAGDRLLLTELEYTERNDNPSHWASAVLHWALREFRMIFVGCSMTDSLVRRALCRTRFERLKDMEAEFRGSLPKSRRKPKHFVACNTKGDEQLEATLLKSYEEMDLNVLWVKDYEEDLPARLKILRDALRC